VLPGPTLPWGDWETPPYPAVLGRRGMAPGTERRGFFASLAGCMVVGTAPGLSGACASQEDKPEYVGEHSKSMGRARPL